MRRFRVRCSADGHRFTGWMPSGHHGREYRMCRTCGNRWYRVAGSTTRGRADQPQVRDQESQSRGAHADRATMPGTPAGRTGKVRGGGKSYDSHVEYSQADLERWAMSKRQRRRAYSGRHQEREQVNITRKTLRRG